MPAEGGEPVVVVPADAPRVVVLAGGDALPPALDADVAAAMDGAELTIAADGGIRHAHRVDRDPDVLVGDLDSVTPDELDRAMAATTEVLRHPADKDATDLELALELALDLARDLTLGRGPGDHPGDEDPGTLRLPVLVVGGHGGRNDHLLANVLLLTAERYRGLRLTAWWGVDILHVVRDRATLNGRIGSTVSLLAVHGPAHGVTTHGLQYPLDDAVLGPGSTLGVSNRLVESPATVLVLGGVVAAIHSPPA
jgi:thiamine pyrophosphokinase